MSFLNDIFGKRKPTGPKSGPFRELLQSYVDQLPAPLARNDHNICLDTLASALRFGDANGTPDSSLSQFMTDTCLFELACYVLASADFWAFNKAHDKRPHIQQILFSQLDAISTRSGFLPDQASYEYANSRVGLYGGIAASGSGVEGLHLRLKQALRHASRESKPAKSLDDVPPIFADATNDLLLTKSLIAWDMKRMVEMDSKLSKIAKP